MRNKKVLSAIVCSFLLIVGIQSKAINSREIHQISSEELEVIELGILKSVPTLGTKNIVANYLFLKFLIYFGDEELRGKDFLESLDLIEASVHHDPYFTDLYLFLSQSATVYSGQPERTVQVISENTKHLQAQQPHDSYRVMRYKAIDELLFLGNSYAAQQSFSIAGEWGAQSSDPYIQQIARRSKQTAEFLKDNPDSSQAQISAWASVATTTFDIKTRQLAIERIRELGGDIVFNENGSVSVRTTQAEKMPQSDSDI